MKVKELLKRNRIYETVAKQMLNYQNAYLGGLVFKQSVRRKRPSEDSVLYLDLVNNTVSQPICRYIVDTINDVLFEPGVKRNLQFCTEQGVAIDPTTMDWPDLFCLDADLQNRSMTGFMEQVGDLSSIFGHCWVVVDLPRAEEGNLGRPYVVALSPLDVWDWEWEFYNGKPMLEYVKIKEFEDDDCYYIKCLHMGDATTPSYWRHYEVPKTNTSAHMDDDAKMTGAGFFPPGMSVPAFIAYGRKDPRTIDLGVSDIDSATDAQREYYKLECEAYGAIQFAHTIVRADKGVTVPVHAGAIVRATAGQIEAIEINTGDVDAVIKKQQDILEQMEALTGLGGLRNSKNQIASGTAIIEERKQLHRLAKAKARLMEVTEEMIFTYAARFMGMRWAGEVNYNTDYEAHDTNYRLALMNQAKILVPDNDIVNSLIAKEVIAMLAPAESIPEYEQAYINTIPNATVKTLMTEENVGVYSRDLGSQLPKMEDAPQPIDPALADDTAIDTESGDNYGADKTALIGGVGTPTQQTGLSYYPQQAVAVQLTGLNIGR